MIVAATTGDIRTDNLLLSISLEMMMDAGKPAHSRESGLQGIS